MAQEDLNNFDLTGFRGAVKDDSKVLEQLKSKFTEVPWEELQSKHNDVSSLLDNLQEPLPTVEPTEGLNPDMQKALGDVVSDRPTVEPTLTRDKDVVATLPFELSKANDNRQADYAVEDALQVFPVKKALHDIDIPDLKKHYDAKEITDYLVQKMPEDLDWGSLIADNTDSEGSIDHEAILTNIQAGIKGITTEEQEIQDVREKALHGHENDFIKETRINLNGAVSTINDVRHFLGVLDDKKYAELNDKLKMRTKAIDKGIKDKSFFSLKTLADIAPYVATLPVGMEAGLAKAIVTQGLAEAPIAYAEARARNSSGDALVEAGINATIGTGLLAGGKLAGEAFKATGKAISNHFRLNTLKELDEHLDNRYLNGEGSTDKFNKYFEEEWSPLFSTQEVVDSPTKGITDKLMAKVDYVEKTQGKELRSEASQLGMEAEKAIRHGDQSIHNFLTSRVKDMNPTEQLKETAKVYREFSDTLGHEYDKLEADLSTVVYTKDTEALKFSPEPPVGGEFPKHLEEYSKGQQLDMIASKPEVKAYDNRGNLYKQIDYLGLEDNEGKQLKELLKGDNLGDLVGAYKITNSLLTRANVPVEKAYKQKIKSLISDTINDTLDSVGKTASKDAWKRIKNQYEDLYTIKESTIDKVLNGVVPKVDAEGLPALNANGKAFEATMTPEKGLDMLNTMVGSNQTGDKLYGAIKRTLGESQVEKVENLVMYNALNRPDFTLGYLSKAVQDNGFVSKTGKEFRDLVIKVAGVLPENKSYGVYNSSIEKVAKGKTGLAGIANNRATVWTLSRMATIADKLPFLKEGVGASIKETEGIYRLLKNPRVLKSIVKDAEEEATTYSKMLLNPTPVVQQVRGDDDGKI